MPLILSVSSHTPDHILNQATTEEFARDLFEESFQDIDRLLTVFQNGQIEERQLAVPLSWFQEDRSLKERNDLFIEQSLNYSVKAIEKCLRNSAFLNENIDYTEIDAIIFVTSSGIATPSMDARLMNRLPFSIHTKRIPLWGLGCAGGAVGISRAFEYCRAFPEQNVLLVCAELCSLTFQRSDRSKSNLVGTSLFGDGIACALVAGDASSLSAKGKKGVRPFIMDTESTLMPDSEEVMGWDVKDSGLHVVFSRSIPSVITKWLEPTISGFLERRGLEMNNIASLIAHPGGKKVLDAYASSLQIEERMLDLSKEVLRRHGNMSSPTILYVLEQEMMKEKKAYDRGLMVALGPGFCSELVLLQWREEA